MNDNFEELFDGAIAVNPYEKGETFSMSAACYTRMATAAMRAMQYGHCEPVLIRRLQEGPGCELVLYGSCNAYTLRVYAESEPARLMLCYLPLDSRLSGPGAELFRGIDQYQDWHLITSMMVWREGTVASEELLEWAEICEALAEGNGWEEL